nr:hypothetical protein [Mycobacterium pseudoshottsii]
MIRRASGAQLGSGAAAQARCRRQEFPAGYPGHVVSVSYFTRSRLVRGPGVVIGPCSGIVIGGTLRSCKLSPIQKAATGPR